MSASHRSAAAFGCVLIVSGICVAQQDPHGPHHESEAQKGYATSRSAYRIPPVTLRDHAGRPVELASELDSPHPVALNFIFTTCSTICPVMTATFARMREELGPEANAIHFISVSIDPEYDTPRVLKSYAERYRAGDGWKFLTGEVEEIVSVLQAFDAYRGGKNNHRPFTFFKASGSHEWLRIEGLASGKDLAVEYRQLLQER
jgi:protein SCO1/2